MESSTENMKHNLQQCSNKHFAQMTLGEALTKGVWPQTSPAYRLTGVWGPRAQTHALFTVFFFLCLLDLWVRVTLSTGPATF